jgi:hypothetical protein
LANLSQQLRSDHGLQQRTSGVNDTHSFKQLVAWGALQNGTLCASLDRRHNAIVAIEGGEHDYPHLGTMRLHLFEGFDTIHLGHLEVKQHHIRPELRRHSDNLRSATRLPDYREVRLRSEHGHQTLPYDRMVIGDKYADRFAQDHSQRDADRDSRAGPYAGLQAHFSTQQSSSFVNSHQTVTFIWNLRRLEPPSIILYKEINLLGRNNKSQEYFVGPRMPGRVRKAFSGYSVHPCLDPRWQRSGPAH